MEIRISTPYYESCFKLLTMNLYSCLPLLPLDKLFAAFRLYSIHRHPLALTQKLGPCGPSYYTSCYCCLNYWIQSSMEQLLVVCVIVRVIYYNVNFYLTSFCYLHYQQHHRCCFSDLCYLNDCSAIDCLLTSLLSFLGSYHSCFKVVWVY